MKVRTLTRHLPITVDAVALFRTLTGGGTTPHTCLLESGDTTTRTGEKSLVTSRSAVHFLCENRTVHVTALNRNGGNVLPWLRQELSGRGLFSAERPDGFSIEFPLVPKVNEEERLRAPSPVDVLRAAVRTADVQAGGEAALMPLVVGCFSYDFLGAFEALPPAQNDPLGWPDFEFWLPDELVWVNHRTGSCTLVCHAFGDTDAELLYNDAQRAIAAQAAAVERARGETVESQAMQSHSAPEIRPELTDAEFAALVERLKAHIVKGDVFQIVPSREFSLPCAAPLAAFARLRTLNPSPYMFFLNGTRGVLFGASPETALQYKARENSVSIFPIAGTRGRGRAATGAIDADLDGRLEAELRLDQKELAEHMMLVDLARNDVARVSRPGTRAVASLCQVVRYSHVMHLVSHVTGQLREDLDALHAYLATMNMGTVVGAPKLKAAELLRRNEPSKRGPYGGAVAYYNAAGDFDSGIVIRSAVVQNGIAHVRAGAGVVFDSDPLAEARETSRKAQAVLTAIAREVPQ